MERGSVTIKSRILKHPPVLVRPNLSGDDSLASPEIPAALLPWALSVLGAAPKQGAAVGSVAGDASNRHYFRLQLEDDSRILVHAPPASENNQAFLDVAGLLEQGGVRVPAIEAVDLEQGFLLLEDLGDQLLLPALNEKTAPGHYQHAMSTLLRMSAVVLSPGELHAYDEALLDEELSRFGQWFVTQLLGYQLNDQEQAMLQRLFRLLIDSALEQPSVFVHRDFHSRNLMLLPAGELAVIDFQDAVRGPITYDIVSLLRDCYIGWPERSVREWALAYRDLLCEQGLLAATDDATFLRWFDWMGLQRHLKVLGTFARLFLRDGKEAYLADLPLVIDYVLRVVARYAGQNTEFAEFGDWFAQKLSPRIARHAWSGAA
jgi:aminoglycoside/choline kinase family phosphotransferase